MIESPKTIRLNNMTHFSWGEDQQQRLQTLRYSRYSFWRDFKESILGYVKAGNREFDKQPIGFQIEADEEENTLTISLDIFKLCLLHSIFTGEVFFAFKSEVLCNFRPSHSDIWIHGVFRPGETGIDIVPDILFWEESELMSKSYKALTWEELSQWPMHDRLARWCLDMLIEGDRSICNNFCNSQKDIYS